VSDLIARATAVATVFLAAAAVVALYVTSRPDVLRGGSEVTAVFEDAYPLLEGMHVRVDGAVAGTVREIELGDDGNAHITMQLFEGTSPPRSDAVATIRQEDITGDSYVSLTLGEATESLGEAPIPAEQTMSAPRFDDLLNAFDEPVRRGLELLFVELGRTLESRGEDLNRAALRLRPGLDAANRALAEVSSQTRVLRDLIEDARAVTAQASERAAELGNSIGAFAATVRTTRDHLPALDRGLEAGPATLAAAKETLGKLAGTTDAAIPFAETLYRAAPQLALTSVLLGPFLDDAELIIGDVEPTLDLMTELLRASLPTLETSPKRVFTAPFDLTAGFGAVLDTLIGDPALVESLFSADCYGGRVPGCDLSDDAGLGAVAVEGGNLPGYPANDPERFFVRSAAVPSCENFGVPIAPNCLTLVTDALGAIAGILPGLLPAGARAGERAAATAAGSGDGGAEGAGGAGDGPGSGPQAPAGASGPAGDLGNTLNDALENLGLGNALGGAPGGGKDKGQGKDGKDKGGKQEPPQPNDPLGELLDFLLGP
jgi:ABC-type transporter Mla subunit MlaD